MPGTTEDVRYKVYRNSRLLLKQKDSTKRLATLHTHIPNMVQTSYEDYCDALIVGAGPAGLMMAMTLARMGIKPTIIDAAGYESHEYGRADALQPRSMEVMQTFGMPMEQLEAAGKKIFGRAFWEISGESTRRTASARFFPPFLDFDKDYALAVRQGLIEQVMIHDIERHCDNFEVQWHTEFLDMELSAIPSGPSAVVVRQSQTGETKTIMAKYVIAADGGKSSVRRWASRLDVRLEGGSLPVTWCVLDAVGIKSNHPDLERLSVLRSSRGIVLIIPREPINGKPSARFDIQLANSKQEATQEEATRLIKEIFHPYHVEWEEVNWWSAYEVGQRIINRYSVGDTLFFVGDSCHTHSPRAGLGLNTAVLESHNLAWKMGLVLQGMALPQILATYELERHGVAKDLIHMDRRLVEIYAGLEKQSIDDFSGAAEWLSTLHNFQAANYAYQAGASIVYQRTVLTGGPRKRGTMKIGKPDVIVGSRARPATVTRLSDSVPVPILSRFDGRFTVYFMVGDLSRSGAFENLLDLDEFIRRPKSIFWRFGSNLGDKAKHRRLSALWRPQVSHHTHSQHNVPDGRALYSYIYDDIPQVTAPYHGASHSIIHTSIITTLGSTSRFVNEHITNLSYPTQQPATPYVSPIFRPQHFFCDDIPVVSPYRESAPEAGSIFEHPMHNKWGIDPAIGAIVVARPDGHIALKTKGFGVDAWQEVESYFEGFLIPHKARMKRKEAGSDLISINVL